MIDAAPIRVMALHALAYCERLFYLEEVEEIRVADERVFDGRALHEALDEDGTLVEMTIESASLGIKGKLDALRRRDGKLIPYEHKKGRARKADGERVSPPSVLTNSLSAHTLATRSAGRPCGWPAISRQALSSYLRGLRILRKIMANPSRKIGAARPRLAGAVLPNAQSQPERCSCAVMPVSLPRASGLILPPAPG